MGKKNGHPAIGTKNGQPAMGTKHGQHAAAHHSGNKGKRRADEIPTGAPRLKALKKEPVRYGRWPFW